MRLIISQDIFVIQLQAHY